MRLIQILEFDFQTFPCANGDADAGPQAEIEIVGGKLLILKEDCKFNLLKKGGFSALISKETNERCGSLITMSDGNLGSIEIPDQDEGAMQFNREELMCSQID